MKKTFRVALTADFYEADGTPKYPDIGIDLIENAPNMEVTRFAEHRAEMEPAQYAGCQGVIVFTPRVTTRTLEGSEDLLALGRFGVGYDLIDVPACTKADVALYITTGSGNYAVASATVCFILALVHQLRVKDRQVREGRWQDKSEFVGYDLRNRTLGIIGFGGIGKGVLRLLVPFGMKPPLVYSPSAKPADLAEFSARSVSLDELLRESDVVSVHCPLSDRSRNMIAARELGLMKPTAIIVNTARGGIINEDDLFEALSKRKILGAGIDCFVGEPLKGPSRFGQLDNVLMASHNLAWSDELFRGTGRAACQGMVDLAQRKVPFRMVNPEVLDKPSFQKKWERLCG